MDTKTITAQTKKAVAIGLCASLIGGVAAPVLSTANVAHAAGAPKPPINTQHSHIIKFKDENLKNSILSEMKKQNLIDQAAVDITEDDSLKAKELTLYNNHITSIEGLENFKNLTSLFLNNNNISDLKPLAELTKLTALYLNNNNISDLKPLAKLTNLTKLFITNNQIADIKPLTSLTGLTWIYLNKNHISDLTPLANLTKLVDISLSDNVISDITPLKNLTNLETLDLGRNQVSDFTPLTSLTDYPGLLGASNQTITLHTKSSTVDLTQEIKGTGKVVFESDENIVNGVLTYKSGMKNPYVVKVRDIKGGYGSYSATINVDFSQAKKETVIQFKDKDLKDEILQYMKNEGIVSSTATEITEADALKVTKLDLSDSQRLFDVISLEGLQNFKNLTFLNINHNHLPSYISDLKPLAGLTKLMTIKLWSYNISDLNPLKGLTNLESLELYNNSISDLKPLEGLTKLTNFAFSSQYVELSSSTRIYHLDTRIFSYADKLLLTPEVTDVGSFNPESNEFTLNILPTRGEVQIANFKYDSNVNKLAANHDGRIFVDFTPYINTLKERVKASGAFEADQQKIIDKINRGNVSIEEIENDINSLQGKTNPSGTQTDDVSGELQKLLDSYNSVKATDNYKNADDNLKQAYDTAITDGQKVYNKLSSTPEQVQQACAQIKAAFSKLNGDAKASTTASQLQNRIQQLEQELEQAKQQGTADKATIERITNELQQTKQQLEQLKQDKTKSDTEKQQEIDKLNNQIEDLNKQITQLTNDKKTLSEQLQQAQSNLADVQKKLQTATEHGAADKSKIEELNGQISTLNGQLEQLKQDKTKSDEQKQQEITKLNGQITNLGKQIEKLTQENTTLKGQVASLQEQLGKLQGQLQNAQQQGIADKATIERLTGQVTTLSSQLEALKADKTRSDQEKQREIEQLTAQLRDLTSQVNVLTNEKRTLQQQLDAATGKISALTSELERLKVTKEQADEKNQQTIAALNSQIVQLNKDKQGLQDQINTKQTEISKLQGQIQALKDDHSKSDTEKLKKIEQLTAQLATLTQEKQGLQGKLDAANEKISTFTQQLQQAQSRADADTKQIQELTNALQQAKQQLEQLKSDKTKSDEQKQQEIDTLNAKIAELEKKVQTCRVQAVGGAIVAPLVNEKPTFDIEKYKREHNYMLPGSASYTLQTNPDAFTSDVHAALQQLAPMAASTNAAAQATAQRTDESERAQAEQKADTSSKQDADKTILDQNKFPQTGDNSLLALLSTFAGALVLVLGCFARKKSSKANKR